MSVLEGDNHEDAKQRNQGVIPKPSFLYRAVRVVANILGAFLFSALLRLVACLPARYFGWEVGSWFTWLVWGTSIGGILGALFVLTGTEDWLKRLLR
jgi:hypothetical protein